MGLTKSFKESIGDFIYGYPLYCEYISNEGNRVPPSISGYYEIFPSVHQLNDNLNCFECLCNSSRLPSSITSRVSMEYTVTGSLSWAMEYVYIDVYGISKNGDVIISKRVRFGMVTDTPVPLTDYVDIPIDNRCEYLYFFCCWPINRPFTINNVVIEPHFRG